MTADAAHVWQHMSPALSTAAYRSLLLGDVDSYVDIEGRPIGEVRADPRVRSMVETRYRTCPYPGSRRDSGRLMNVSALRQVGRHWDEVLGLVSDLARFQRERSHISELTLLDVAQLSYAGLHLPAFLLFRATDAQAETCVPVHVAAASKLLAGIFGLAKNLLLSYVAVGRPYRNVHWDPAELSSYAESSGMLVGRSGTEVCAGPPEMIDEVLHLLASPPRPSDRGSAEAWIELDADPAAFLGYADAVADSYLWLLVTTLCCRELMSDLRGQVVPAQDTALAALFKTYDSSGFGVRVIPAVALLDGSSSRALRRGATSLFTLPPISLDSPLLSDEGGGSAQVGTLWNRCVAIEREAVASFNRLHCRHAHFLGLPQPDPADSQLLSRLFGALPRQAFEAVGLLR